MNILAIDTSGPACSVALVRDGMLLGETVMNAARTHSETLMPAVDEVLSRAGASVREIDVFAAVAGPGSFTGVRIGVCAARALAHAANKPCARVNALLALAAGAPYARGVLCPILDARRGQVYCAAFRYENGLLPARVLGDAALPLLDFLRLLPADEPLYFTGDGVFVHEKAILDALGARAALLPPHARVLRASAAATVALYDETLRTPPEGLTPIYLRAPQAEREREERLTRQRV